MSAAHTPGPWWFDQASDEITCEAREGKVEIASVVTGWAPSFEAEQQANARLIAAAPELLAVLLMVKEAAIDERGLDFNLTTEQWAVFHAAIAKATGAAA